MIPTSWLYKILGIAAAAAALLWLVQSRDHWRDKARANEKLFHAEQAAHQATVANYRAAADRARRDDAANIARVKADQARINERTTNDFESRIAAARASAERLRQRSAASRAGSGAGGGASVPGLPASAGRAAEGAGEDGLPESPGWTGPAGDPMNTSDRLLATEQAIQLDELVKWVRRQAAVPSSVAPAKAGKSD